LGVDIGTTYVAAAVADDDGVEVVTVGTSATTEPAVVLARRDGTVLVGEAAVRRAPTEPTAVGREAKRRFGDPVPLVLDGVPWSADLLTAHVLRNIVDRVAGERDRGPTAWG
jgi:molecular chaperone DnaK (HSP70)